MTISIAWLRTLPNDDEELWVVSDSRLSTGATVWDECTKIFTLPDKRSFVSFAGDTSIAFPLINQFQTSIIAHRSSLVGFMDINELKNHFVIIINNSLKKMRLEVNNYNVQDTLKDTSFILGGYSWRRKRFSIYKISYNNGKYTSTKEKTSGFKNVYCQIIGDITPFIRQELDKKMYSSFQNKREILRKMNTIKEMYTQNLITKKSYCFFKDKLTKKEFDMEPFEVVRDLLINKNNQDLKLSSVGGAPQLVKVYQHMNAQPIGVFWNQDSSKLQDKSLNHKNLKPTLLGRFLEDYENPDMLFMDLNSHIAKLISRPNVW